VTSIQHAAARLRVSTRDLDTARDEIARVFADHDLEVKPPGALDMRLDLAIGSRLSIGLMSYGAQASVDAPPMRSYYHVNLPLTGHGAVSQGGERREVRAGITGAAFLPSAPLSLTWSPDQRQYVIQFRKEHLEAQAARLAGQPLQPVEFDLTFDLTSPAAQSLCATAGFVHGELLRPGGAAAFAPACRELETALMTQLLLAVPSQLSRFLHTTYGTTRSAHIREIIRRIDLDPEPDLVASDLAAEAGISVRSLQLGFQETVGMTPTAYLRVARLDRVHAELLTGTGRNVTDTAMRWGFHHPGRFSQQYRERFGVLPSETSRRRRLETAC
jgi:AraC-like DNA-binding protein